MSIKNITPKGRFHYVHLDKPTAAPGSDKLTYQVTLIWDSKTDISELLAAQDEAAIEEFGKKKYDILKKTGDFKSLIKSNATRIDKETGEQRPGFEDKEGHHATFKIWKDEQRDSLMIVGADKKDLPRSLVVGGYYGKVIAGLQGFDKGGSQGVLGFLNGIQVIAKGDVLASGGSANVDDFGDEADTESENAITADLITADSAGEESMF